MKFLKILLIPMSLGVVGIVPVLATSCSTSNTYNVTNEYSNFKPGDNVDVHVYYGYTSSSSTSIYSGYILNINVTGVELDVKFIDGSASASANGTLFIPFSHIKLIKKAPQI